MGKEKSSSVGRGLGVIGVLLNYGMARIVPGAGVRRLVYALGSPDEDTSVAAYMALVKLGPRNAKRLLEEAKKGQQTASLLQVLGDLHESSIIPDLEEFARSPDRKVADAARESLEALRSDEADGP